MTRDSSQRRAAKTRLLIAQTSHRANSSHLGSSLSCVEILDAAFRASNLRPDTVGSKTRDRIIMSKGHAAMAYYATLVAHDLMSVELLAHYQANGTPLWGHVSQTAAVPAIDSSTGSLGHGLGLAVGHALAYRLKGVNGRQFCILSDGECNEGSVWEAAQFAGHHKLTSVAALLDYNKIQSIGFCADVLNPEPFADKWRSFGWEAIEVTDGHDSDAIFDLLNAPRTKPLVLICHTVKGKGIPRIEATVASHYKPATTDDLAVLEEALCAID